MLSPCGMPSSAADNWALDRCLNELIIRWSTISANPASIAGRPGGSLAVGAPADVAVIDPERRWRYDPAKGFSKSRNSPWAGREMVGRAIATLVAGRLVYDVERGMLVP